jgi:hypothetical protein
MYKFGLDPRKARPAVRASEEPIIRFFSYHDAHPIALGMVVLERFGPEALDWEHDTLRREIVEDFNATSVSDHNWQKIQAFRTLLLATSPWQEWEVFENVIQALNNNIPDPEMVQRCSVAQIMAGVDIINEIRSEPFGVDVARYVAACAIENGVTYLPDPLGFARETLADPQYVCMDCGNVDDDDLTDDRCDVCTRRFEDHRPLNGKPADGVPESAGKKLQKFKKRDPAAAEEQFEAWKNIDDGVADVDAENPAHVQAAKLVVAYRYMLRRRRELVEQLEELKSWVKH